MDGPEKKNQKNTRATNFKQIAIALFEKTIQCHSSETLHHEKKIQSYLNKFLINAKPVDPSEKWY